MHVKTQFYFFWTHWLKLLKASLCALCTELHWSLLGTIWIAPLLGLSTWQLHREFLFSFRRLWLWCVFWVWVAPRDRGYLQLVGLYRHIFRCDYLLYTCTKLDFSDWQILMLPSLWKTLTLSSFCGIGDRWLLFMLL